MYTIEEDVPEYWDFIIDSFLSCVQYAVELQQMPEVTNIRFYTKRGLLGIEYEGGNLITDGFTALSKTLSSKICSSCGAHSVRSVFGNPRCDDCT